jgi:hypothetical protein
MAAVVETSSYSLANGGQVASEEIPKDGTGKAWYMPVSLERHKTNKLNRSHSTRSLAFAVQGLS